jgi:hypothetical protein
LSATPAGALVIGGDAFLIGRSEQLATLALRHAVRRHLVAGSSPAIDGGQFCDDWK